MKRRENIDPSTPSSVKTICIKKLNPACECHQCQAKRRLAEAAKFKMNNDPAWLMEKVAQDDGEITSVGGLIVELEGE